MVIMLLLSSSRLYNSRKEQRSFMEKNLSDLSMGAPGGDTTEDIIRYRGNRINGDKRGTAFRMSN